MDRESLRKRLFAVFCLLAVSVFESAPELMANPESEPALTAERVSADYFANAISADEKYLNRSALITGTIREFGIDPMGGHFIVLYSEESGFSSGVRCSFASDNDEAGLSKGQIITIRGVIKGASRNMDSPGGVLVENCSVIKSEGVQMISIQSSQLYAYYNQERWRMVDGIYKYKVAKITGIVREIAKDERGKPYVLFIGSGQQDGDWGVRCELRASETSKAATLSRGQTASIIGRIMGRDDPNDYGIRMVLVEDCVLTE